MKRIIVLVALFAAVYYAYKSHYLGGVSSASQYSISNIQNQPIPQDALFELWHEAALKMCNDSVKSFNISQSQCINRVDSRKESCKAIGRRNASTVVESEYEAKQLGKACLHCAIPGYYCNGTEVKTEEEARRNCQ
ncbi:hypothetical protein [Bowmanella yangjiangensis]|uniref:DUF4189 domain-containing protein n=1 Tax=Bowmanella yangjiangensis TaxID=2811230 RepID=A0ABS3CZ62_9ALTE|nr:hypothetical protein [Bowmanella yangjiangensis]MBN7822378.1 hypothetical protein [Bowmanella yangjiangensis]